MLNFIRRLFRCCRKRPMPNPVRTSRGASTAFSTTSLTITGVQVGQGSTLIVFVGATATDGSSGLNITSVMWGGNAMSLVATSNIAGHISAAYILENATAGTNNVVVSFSRSSNAVGIAEEISLVATSNVTDGGGNGSGTNQTPTISMGQTSMAPTMFVACAFAFNPDSQDNDHWDSPADFNYGRFEYADTVLEGATVWGITGYKVETTFPVSRTISKTIPGTSSHWLCVGLIIKGVASAVPVPLGGYTSYDLGLTDPELGALVSPEKEARIRAGDRRFMQE